MATTSHSIGISIGGALNPSLGKAFGKVRQSQASLASDMRNTSSQLKAVQSFNKYKQTLDELKAKQSQLTHQSPKLDRGIAEVQRRFDNAQKQVQKYGLEIGKTTKLEKTLESQLGRTKRALDAKNKLASNKAARQSMHGEIMGTMGLAYIAAAPLRTAINYEQSIAKLGAITQATDDEKKALDKTARELGAATQFSASESADAMTFLGMAGFKTNQIIEATPGMLDLAAAAGTDLGQTADIASNILSGFSLEASEAGRVGDVLAKAFTSSNTDLAMLGETMKYVAPVASAVGASLEDMAAMAGMLGNVGIQGGQAGTALRAAMLSLIKPPKMAADAMDDLGLSITDANGKMKSMPSILADIDKATEGMGETDRLAIITKMFGTEAASAMTELVKQAGTGSLQAYSKQIKDSEGLAKKMAKEMNATTYGQLKQLGSAMESLTLAIINPILPALTAIAKGAAAVASGFAKVASAVPWLTGGIIGLTVAFVAGKVAFLAYRYAATLVSDAVTIVRMGLPLLSAAASTVTARFNIAALATGRFTKSLWTSTVAAKASIAQLGYFGAAKAAVVSFSTAAVAGIRAIGVALIANPIGLVIAGIATAAFLVYKYWKPLGAFFKGMWQGLTETARPLTDALSGMFSMLEPIANGFKAVGKWVSALIGPVESSTESLEDATEAGKTFGKWIGIAFDYTPVARFARLLDWVGVQLKTFASWAGISLFDSDSKELAKQADALTAIKPNKPSKWAGMKSEIGETFNGHWAGVKGIFGGRDKQEQAAISAPTSKVDLVESPSARSAQAQKVVNNTPQNTFNITQAPGEDAESLARRIARIQEESAMRMEYDFGG